jgi:hypothetical protein
MPRAKPGNLSQEEKDDINRLINNITKSNTILDKELKTLVSEQDEIKKTLRKQTITYVLTILGAMAALSWKTVIETGVMHFLKSTKDNIKTHVFSAIIITLIVVCISYLIIRYAKIDKYNISDL